jgi:hypothetical protein
VSLPCFALWMLSTYIGNFSDGIHPCARTSILAQKKNR